MVRRLGISAALVLTAATAYAGDIGEDLVRAYDLAYNLDHDAAVDVFEATIATDPNNPAAHRGLAAMTWMRLLFLRGTMTVDDYLGGVSPKNVDLPEPPPELAAAFDEHSTRALALSEAMVRENPDSAEAHYQLGASLGLATSYRATIHGETMGALKPAKAAFAAHERVLELDPTRKDAMLVVGTYRYLVSTLPLPIRLMARMVGFGGGKEEGLRLIQEAATYDGDTRTEAEFGLVLVYNRERNFAAAQRVLRDLKRRYPRNRVVWLEAAATALRDDRPALAASSLRDGFSMLEADGRVRMPGEDALWRYVRGRTQLELKRDAAARRNLLAVLDLDARLWVTGRTHIELGKLADLSGNRKEARRHYETARKFCTDGRDKRGANLAKRLENSAYLRE
jgi:tetratricopeptide (TPR) repeat protein